MKVSGLLLLISVILSGLGGIADITGRQRVLGLTREHYWTDAVYLAVLAIAVHMILRM